MSFESGRKLGLVASLIAVIAPVVSGILSAASFLSLFTSSTSASSPSPLLPLFSGIELTAIAVGVLGLAGVILFLVAMHRLSRYYDEPAIFKNALNAFLTGIIGAAVIISLLAVFFLTIVHVAPLGVSAGWLIVIGILGLFVVALVTVIVSAVFYKRAFDTLAERSGSYSFNTAGTMFLWGAVLTIILIGGLLTWVAWIFALSGFSSMKPKAAEPVSPYSSIQPPTAFSRRYCQYCGAENTQDAVYCQACGRQIQTIQ